MRNLYSFSGIDSSGKSTQIELFRAELEAQGRKVRVLWSRGGYTPGMEFIKKLARELLGKRLPSEGHSTKRDDMLKKKSVSSLWYILAIVDFCMFHAVYVRLLHGLRYSIILDRAFCDTDVDMRMYHDQSHRRFWFLWKIAGILAPTAHKAFYFKIDAHTSLDRSIAKGEMYAESLEAREERLKHYRDVLSRPEYAGIIQFDSVVNSTIEIAEKVKQA